MLKRAFSVLLSLCLLASVSVVSASAELVADYPVLEPAEISISPEETTLLAQRLAEAKRTDAKTFEIIDATAPGSARVSIDYTVSSLNVQKGIITVNSDDEKILDDMLAEAGLSNASDAEKVAWALAWIHNNLVYSGYHTGTYVYSSFREMGGQCNVYNGALGALLNHLGYQVQMVRGYRASTGSQSGHWWLELLTDGEPYVFECGNIEDGTWYYLGATYAETHGGDRDYIKSGLYAWSGEEYAYLGAAAYRLALDMADGITVTGRVKRGNGYTVTEVGLMAGQSADDMTPVASDIVDSTFTAPDSEGFAIQYTLSDCGILPQPGETWYYAFYVMVDGLTLVGTPGIIALEPEAEASAVEVPAQAAPAEPPRAVLLAGALVLILLLLAGIALISRRHIRKKTGSGLPRW